ncbi:hypothetical protein E4U53_001980 [Claviceps sorghi]|nr:hypothetical protein E4U53_001980 [Claviceps sorghi]
MDYPNTPRRTPDGRWIDDGAHATRDASHHRRPSRWALHRNATPPSGRFHIVPPEPNNPNAQPTAEILADSFAADLLVRPSSTVLGTVRNPAHESDLSLRFLCPPPPPVGLGEQLLVAHLDQENKDAVHKTPFERLAWMPAPHPSSQTYRTFHSEVV